MKEAGVTGMQVMALTRLLSGREVVFIFTHRKSPMSVETLACSDVRPFLALYRHEVGYSSH